MQPGDPTPVVPYWNARLEMPPASASPEEVSAFRNRPEIRFAQQIQQHFADELLRMRRLDGSSGD